MIHYIEKEADVVARYFKDGFANRKGEVITNWEYFYDPVKKTFIFKLYADKMEDK